jgi:serine phosphatase RsbU (regulator of sigma subunit)
LQGTGAKYKKEIAESLKYASYIQQALFPSPALVKRLLPEHFLYYKPRDVVSGDFYFVSAKGDEIILAVGDCTGHGVPGAFMSILGITFLNEIVTSGNFHNASAILNQLRERVMKALCQTGDDQEQKDGIDLALCLINKKMNRLHFSGAFNPLYIIHHQELIEIQADNMPIGIAADEEKSFTNHQIELQENDSIYLFSDGFIDQFGGPSGKKYKYKPFRNLITELSDLPISAQKNVLDNTFMQWKGNLPQLDDVLVFGCRYHA